MSGAGFDRAAIVRALEAVGRRLDAEGLVGDVYVLGGSALALAYDRARVTRDVDAVFEPKQVVYEAARRVAEEQGLPPGWLNDGVKGFLPGPDPYQGTAFEVPGLRVQTASAEMLLALKVLAHRVGEDDDDLRLLAERLDLATPAAVLDLAESILGPRRLTASARFFVEAVLQPEP